MLLTGAEIVIKELLKQGVDTIFGYPGGYVIDIYDELYKNADKIDHILPAHEQGAAHAADAYARVSGKVGVVIATGGPGATNLVTGIANAYLDSVPMVFITGNVAVPMLGQDSFQDIDIIGVTLPIVKHSYVVKDIKHLQRTLSDAFLIAVAGRKGPVHVDIPKNIQLETAEYDPDMAVSSSSSSADAKSYDLTEIKAAAKLIDERKRPFIFCGGGVSATNTGQLVMSLAEKITAPIGMSMMGIGSVPCSFPLNLGMSGMYGRYASIVAKSEADLVIALGVRFSDRATGSVSEYSSDTAVIHIDIDAAELGKNIKPDVSICGDLKIILPNLLENAQPTPRKYWLDRVSEIKAMALLPADNDFTPRNILACAKKHIDEDTVITTDVGQHQLWVAQHYGFDKPRKFIASGGLGAMGYGLGAAIGASIAQGRKRVVLFTGDGSFGMNLTELATVVTQKLPITIILFNNGTLGMVRQLQAMHFGRRYSNTTLNRKTDFPAVAKAFGIDGCSAYNLAELEDALKSISENLPYFIECKIDIDEKVL